VRVGLTAMVVQGESPAVLQRAVGHLAGTSGGAITLRTRRGDFEYVGQSTAVVRPSDVGVIQPTTRRTLTLITCFPFSYLGPAPDRFIVRARETGGPR